MPIDSVQAEKYDVRIYLFIIINYFYPFRNFNFFVIDCPSGLFDFVSLLPYIWVLNSLAVIMTICLLIVLYQLKFSSCLVHMMCYFVAHYVFEHQVQKNGNFFGSLKLLVHCVSYYGCSITGTDLITFLLWLCTLLLFGLLVFLGIIRFLLPAWCRKLSVYMLLCFLYVWLVSLSGGVGCCCFLMLTIISLLVGIILLYWW